MLFRPAISAIMLTFLITLLPVDSEARKDAQVKSHVKKNNTPVHSHKRKTPNKTKHDNYGTKWNLSLNTGKVGKDDLFTGKGKQR